MTASRSRGVLTLAFLTCSIIALLYYPALASKAASNSLTLCLTVVIPTLFPFMVLSSMLVKTGSAGIIGDTVSPLLGPLLGINGDGVSVFVLGLLGGYPLGAKTVAQMYDESRITSDDAEYLLGFCSNSGPGFIVGACGAGVFGSVKIGLVLLLSHILAAVCVGVIFRCLTPRHNKKQHIGDSVTKPFSVSFVESVRESVRAVMDVSGFVIIVQVLLGVLRGVGAVPPGILGIMTEGFVELTSGVFRLQGLNTVTAATAASFMLGWGGLCVHCQTMSFTAPRGLRLGRYFAGKLMHGVLSALFTLSSMYLLKF